MKFITDKALGHEGGLFALGIGFGAWAFHKFIAPKMYLPQIEVLKKMHLSQIEALQDRVKALEKEIEPYRDFKTRVSSAAMNSTKRGT